MGATYHFEAVRTAFAFVLAVGCASPMSAMKDDNRRLSQTVTELRSERRAQERRVRDLQRQLDLTRAQLVAGAPEGAPPGLRVEVAAPPAATAAFTAAPSSSAGASRVVGIADDGVEIVYEGDAAAGKQALFDEEPAPRPSASRTADPPPPAPRALGTSGDAARRRTEASRPLARPSRASTRDRESPSERTADAGNDYRVAVELVKAGQYADGATALRAFLRKHPRHDYADNAQYWIGEALYAQKDYPTALVEFRAVIETYPRGNKVPDALLKVGYCYVALAQPDKARAVLEQVVNLYPKTEPAVTAAKRLESL